MTNGQICFMNEYCTNCPIRKECTVRPLFYSENAYQKYRKETLAKSSLLAELMGFHKSDISLGLNVGMKMMDKRRTKELELHPTYSPN